MDVVKISSRAFLAGCAAVAALIVWIGSSHPFSPGLIAIEVFLTIIGLFVFGSTKYQLDKNALTYGAILVIAASFFTGWWPQSALRSAFNENAGQSLAEFIGHYFFTLHGLDELFHADTMLFILGLTFFVCVIAQTRILESISFTVLAKNKGNVLPTVALLTALVAAASGILDGVSMIGLMIRTLVIILFLAKADDDAVIFAVIISTVVTTVCGMWLAYGEPPNLIMKANLHPHLTNAFFLRYCLPAAIGTYLIVYWNLKQRLTGRQVSLKTLDVLDAHTADVRFLQASRHGEVLTPIEFLEENRSMVGDHFDAILKRLHEGQPLGEALVVEKVAESTRKKLMGHYLSEDLASALDGHYKEAVSTGNRHAPGNLYDITVALAKVKKERVRSQLIGGLSFIPFIGFLILHAIHHEFPLFIASFSGFAVALIGIFTNQKMRKLAFHEAVHEYKEYLFLFPLFLSITLLQKSGFFDSMAVWLHNGIETLGVSIIAFIQFTGACFLSALLDNNVVADFASRALHGLDIGVLHLFSMAQIAGYAAGGCWTHIGSAQSVVAYAFILKEVDDRYTPFQWIKAMTPVIVEIFVLMAVIIFAESKLMVYLR